MCRILITADIRLAGYATNLKVGYPVQAEVTGFLAGFLT
jgi:hypothetical protein